MKTELQMAKTSLPKLTIAIVMISLRVDTVLPINVKIWRKNFGEMELLRPLVY